MKDEKVEEDDVEKEENENVEEDDDEEADRSQDRDPHFVRACAVEMHLDISQEPLSGKMPRTSWSTMIKHQPLHSP